MKVSICIPTYNRKDYLRQTLDSILAQTYKNYEIVIVDDGSTDGTEQMIKQFEFPVTYHWQKNAGDAAARNKLIELAKGDYITFIDSDDLLLPDSVQRMVEAMEDSADDIIVYGQYYRIDENGKIYGKCNRKLYSGYVTKYLFQSILIHSCGSMFPSKILKKVKFDTSLRVCSDYAMWLELSTKYPFKALTQPTFKRRRHSNNLSATSYASCLIELNVLENFYAKHGKEIILEKIVRKVFAQKTSRAGRSAITEGLYDQGRRLLQKSFRYRPSFKTLMYLVKAIVTKRFKLHVESVWFYV